LDDKIDTGAMILSHETPIDANENAGQLHDRLMTLGSTTVLETLQLIEQGKATTTLQVEQNDNKTANKLNRDNCKIDWTRSASEIHNLIRGLSPYPAAWFILKDNQEEWTVKLFEAKIIFENHAHKIGHVITSKKEIKVAVKEGFIQIESLQFPGKRKMHATELLNGLTFTEKHKQNRHSGRFHRKNSRNKRRLSTNKLSY